MREAVSRSIVDKNIALDWLLPDIERGCDFVCVCLFLSGVYEESGIRGGERGMRRW